MCKFVKRKSRWLSWLVQRRLAPSLCFGEQLAQPGICALALCRQLHSLPSSPWPVHDWYRGTGFTGVREGGSLTRLGVVPGLVEL